MEDGQPETPQRRTARPRVSTTPGSMATRLLPRFNAIDSEARMPTTTQATPTPALFAKRVASVVHQAAPTLSKEDIERNVTSFFKTSLIQDESSLCLLTYEDIPTDKGTPWEYVTVRRAVHAIAECCGRYQLRDNTLFNDVIMAVGSPGSRSSTAVPSIPAFPLGTSITAPSGPSSPHKLKPKDVSSIELDTFGGDSEGFQEWKKHVFLKFGEAGAQEMLTDKSLCIKYSAALYLIKCKLSSALQGGTAAHLNHIHEAERNAAKFFKFIEQKYDQPADQRVDEFQQWITLFTLNLPDVDKCNTFINTFELAVSYLKQYNSVGVTDEALLRALLLHAITGDAYSTLKLELSKDFKLKSADMIEQLKTHTLVLRNDKSYTGEASGAKTLASLKSRRGGKGSPAEPNFDGYRKIPKFPAGICDNIPEWVWKGLCSWRALLNKGNLNESEKTRLCHFKVEKPSSPKKSSPYDKDRGDEKQRTPKVRQNDRCDCHQKNRKTRCTYHDEFSSAASSGQSTIEHSDGTSSASSEP